MQDGLQQRRFGMREVSPAHRRVGGQHTLVRELLTERVAEAHEICHRMLLNQRTCSRTLALIRQFQSCCHLWDDVVLLLSDSALKFKICMLGITNPLD